MQCFGLSKSLQSDSGTPSSDRWRRHCSCVSGQKRRTCFMSLGTALQAQVISSSVASRQFLCLNMRQYAPMKACPVMSLSGWTVSRMRSIAKKPVLLFGHLLRLSLESDGPGHLVAWLAHSRRLVSIAGSHSIAVPMLPPLQPLIQCIGIGLRGNTDCQLAYSSLLPG